MPFKHPEDENAWWAEYNKTRRPNMQAKLTEYLGGKCVVCGVQTDVKTGEIHEDGKAIYVLNTVVMRPNMMRKRIRKWELRCKACSSRHGSGLTGMGKCYCDKCAPLKRAYYKQRSRKHRAAAKARLATGSQEANPQL